MVERRVATGTLRSVEYYMGRPENIVPILTSWIKGRRWSGLGGVEDLKIEVSDFLDFGGSSNHRILAAFIKASGKRGCNVLLEELFLPLLLTREKGCYASYGEGMTQLSCCDGEIEIIEAEFTSEYNRKLFEAFQRRRKIKTSSGGSIRFELRSDLSISGRFNRVTTSALGKADTTNIVVKVDVGEEPPFVIKSYKIISEVNPEPEFLRVLAGVGFRYAPKLYGQIVYEAENRAPSVITVLEAFEVNDGDGRTPFFDSLVADLLEIGEKIAVFNLEKKEIEELIQRKLSESNFIRAVSEHLGGIIAELHHALAKCAYAGFEPDVITNEDADRWARRAHSNLEYSFRVLPSILEDQRLSSFEREVMKAFFDHAEKVKIEIEDRLVQFTEMAGMMKTRTHQDLHLAQMLSRRTRRGFDFIITDFEGDPLRIGSARREKESPLRDLGTMARSFEYIKYASLSEVLKNAPYPEAIALVASKYGEKTCSDIRSKPSFEFDLEALSCLTEYAEKWNRLVEGFMVKGYLRKGRALGMLSLMKVDDESAREVIDLWKMEKAILEIRYELGHRPHNVLIPLEGLLAYTRE
jgi:trehalose synthase-fused probable maltokinase